MMHVILFCLMTAAFVGMSSVPGLTSTIMKLHHPATLLCEAKCSGSVKWTQFQKPSGDRVVAQCDQTSCSPEEGFRISHDQYKEGNLSLTITAADYSTRGWYTCWCNAEDVCRVSLRIESVEFMKQIRPGDPLVMDVPIPERVEVMLNRSGEDDDDDDDGVQSPVSVPVCTVDGREAQCEREYEQRVVFKCSLTLSAVKETDSGVYTVRDTDNHEIISTHTLTLTGNDTDTNNTIPVKGTYWNIKKIFEEEYRGVIMGLVLGLVSGLLLYLGLHMFVVAWIVQCCCCIRKKVKKCWTGDDDHGTLNQESIPGESIKLQVSDND